MVSLALEFTALKVNKLDKIRGRYPYLFSLDYTPLGLRWWFRRHLLDVRPEVTIMVYAMWDGLLSGSRKIAGIQIIDTIDLISRNTQTRQALEREIEITSEGYDQFSDRSLDENYYKEINAEADPKEFAIYDRYNYTLAISQSEAETIRERTRKTQVIYLPMTEDERRNENFYDGAALFTMGDNLFNRQACHYLSRRVLPSVLKSAPDFQIEITGYGRMSLPPQKGIVHRGFVPDLEKIYTHTCFLACPVFGGTGQLIKVVEAMSAGLPAIILGAALHRTPIDHGVNGLVAKDAEEFSQYSIQLWRNRELCRQLGMAARKTIRQNYSHERLLRTFSAVLSENSTDVQSSESV
jgi:glycosyltransferase involved in cell wall biosynthesis